MCCFLFFFAVFVYVYALNTLRVYDIGTDDDDSEAPFEDDDDDDPPLSYVGTRAQYQYDPNSTLYDYYG